MPADVPPRTAAPMHESPPSPGGPAAPPAVAHPDLIPSAAYMAFRRAFDLVGGGLLALPLGLVVAAAAVLVRLDSPGPIFYRQTRVGRGGRPFRMIKIRSMTCDAEAKSGATWSTGKADSRVTRVGRFLRASHVDEFPQIWNVLRGDMTLIGPRPERPVFVDQLVRQVPGYELRLTVKPGVTGLAQLRLPPDQTLADVVAKVAHDVYYIRHLGPRLDSQVAVGTLRLLVREVCEACGETVRSARRAVRDRLPLRTLHEACGAPLRLPSGQLVFETATLYTPVWGDAALATGSLTGGPAPAAAPSQADVRRKAVGNVGRPHAPRPLAVRPSPAADLSDVPSGSVEATVARL